MRRAVRRAVWKPWRLSYKERKTSKERGGVGIPTQQLGFARTLPNPKPKPHPFHNIPNRTGHGRVGWGGTSETNGWAVRQSLSLPDQALVRLPACRMKDLMGNIRYGTVRYGTVRIIDRDRGVGFTRPTPSSPAPVIPLALAQ